MACRNPDLRPAGEEAATALLAGSVAVLSDQRHRAAPLTAQSQTLKEPKYDQKYRRCDPDAAVTRQQTHRNCRRTHEHQRPHQRLLAPVPVTEVPEDRTTQRTGDERDGVGGEGQQGAGQGVEVRKKDLVEDQRRGRAEQEEVVPFDRRPHEARQNGLPQFGTLG